MKTAVKVPIQKTSVYQTVTRQNAVILPPILFAVRTRFGIYQAFFVRFRKNSGSQKTQVFEKTQVIFDKNSGFQIFLANLLLSP